LPDRQVAIALPLATTREGVLFFMNTLSALAGRHPYEKGENTPSFQDIPL